MIKPKQALDYFNSNSPDKLEESATEFWLCNISGDSYYLKWNGCGWTVQYKESFLCKNQTFKHKNDILGFNFSHIPLVDIENYWEHVYDSKEEAISMFKEKIKRC